MEKKICSIFLPFQEIANANTFFWDKIIDHWNSSKFRAEGICAKCDQWRAAFFQKALIAAFLQESCDKQVAKVPKFK